MRKTAMKTVLALLVGAVTLSSCIGSFGLTNKLLDWNKGLSNKFVNELVFILISPAYAVCGLADLLVLNTVEFWTDSKVIAHVGETKEVMGQDGRMYAVKTLKNGYEITDPNGEKSRRTRPVSTSFAQPYTRVSISQQDSTGSSDKRPHIGLKQGRTDSSRAREQKRK